MFGVTLAACVLAGARAHAQGVNVDQPTLGSSVDSDLLADLPLGSTIGSLLDTSIPEVISERVDAGTLVPGKALRVGNGVSWTQTRFRVGDVDITDPVSGGTPLFLPNILAWERVNVTTGATPLDLNAPGLGVTLAPRRPSPEWSRQVEVFGAGPALLSRTGPTTPPSIERLYSWRAANLLWSGPLIAHRLGLVVGATWSDGSSYERSDPTRVQGTDTAAFAHVVFAPTSRDEIRLFTWAEGAASPFDNRIAFGQPSAVEHNSTVHVQSTWERQATVSKWSWRAFAGFTTHEATTELESRPAIVVERLEDGPVPELLSPLGTSRSWSLGATLKPPTRSTGLFRDVQAGIVVSAASARASTPFTGRIGELVDGVPARIWSYSNPGGTPDWHESTLSLFAGDRITITPRVTLEAGMRLELVGASGATNPTAVGWRNWFPQVGLYVAGTRRFPIASFVRFNRSGYRLPLRDLAYGDSLAPVADVFRWNGTPDSDPQLRAAGALVERVGPGTGGDPRFSAIDPGLERPIIDEFVFGFESRPARAVLQFAAFARRERHLIGLVDTGVPLSSYSVSMIRDTGDDRFAGQLLPAYNRTPASFGADRYLLTNPSDNEATVVGVELTAQARIRQLFFTVGGTASRSEGLPANRGFTASENDEGLVGEVFTNPNAGTNAKGRLFTERGYTLTTAGVYQFPFDIKLGLIGRYQDGQHFARLVIVPDLNQGAEAIRAFSPGKTRFTFTVTVDGRLQKTFRAGTSRVTVLLDGYNLLNTATEIEEFSVTGPSSRLTAAVQPPRSLHAGLRITF